MSSVGLEFDDVSHHFVSTDHVLAVKNSPITWQNLGNDLFMSRDETGTRQANTLLYSSKVKKLALIVSLLDGYCCILRTCLSSWTTTINVIISTCSNRSASVAR